MNMIKQQTDAYREPTLEELAGDYEEEESFHAENFSLAGGVAMKQSEVRVIASFCLFLSLSEQQFEMLEGPGLILFSEEFISTLKDPSQSQLFQQSEL
jgi:hypothetical protein